MGTLYRRTEKGAWQAEFTDHNGRRKQRSTKTRDKKTAAQILAHWETQEARRSSGLIDVDAERLSKQVSRPLKDHVDEWIVSVKAKGRSDDYLAKIRAHVDTVLDSAQCTDLAKLASEDVEKYAGQMQDGGAMPRTIQSHLRSIKQFTRWCVRHGRLNRDPLLTIQPPDPESKRSIERRAFTVEEWRYFRDHVTSQHKRFGLTGPERVLVYETSLQTGLRADELRQLTSAKFFFDQDPPFVLASRRSTKNKQPARQYVTRSLANRLRDHIASHSSNLVFEYITTDTADMIRADLETARAAYVSEFGDNAKRYFLTEKNGDGERYDFHALRHTCGAWLALTKVHPKAIQSIMRHSTITLTMNTYGHLFPSMEADAIRALGDLLD